MEFERAKQRISDLTGIINYHNEQYYVKDNPEIKDFEYDILMQELKSLEEEFPELAKSDSPTKKVGGEVLNEFEKVEHKVQMGRLQDVFSFEQVEAFFIRCKNSRITSYNVCYTKLLRPHCWRCKEPILFSVITSYSIHYTKLYDSR